MKNLLTAALVSAGLATGTATGVTALAASAPAASASTTSSVTISNESGTTWTCGFNPFNPSVNYLSFGTVYEELAFVDSLKNGQTTPWLATGWKWTDNGKTLTFAIRKGVTWSDGKPFTAADVAFTFNLLKKFPGLDLNASWTVLSSVTQQGNNVVFRFKKSAVPYFYFIADQTPIVPEHIWASIKNPVNYADTAPVGTGPYTMHNCTPENITYTKNMHYWQPGLPKIDTVYYPSFTSNDPANEELAAGTAQWGSQFIPNIKGYYLSKSPDYHIWFPPVTSVSIFINLTDSQLSLPVREAMAYGINRSTVSKVGEYGYEPPADQSDIVLPTFAGWYDKSLAKQYNYAYNPAKARSVLEKAGYKMSGGVFEKDGKKLSFTIINIGGYSDWVASVSVIASELRQVGIELTPDNLSSTTYDAQLYAGHYQLAYGDEANGGPTPYYEMRDHLYSGNTAPIGQDASTNFERYSNPATDAIINAYGATTNVAEQHKLVDELQKVVLSDVPIIPVTEEVDWYQYDTAHISGWATPSDPYAQPAAYALPDIGVVLLHLAPKG